MTQQDEIHYNRVAEAIEYIQNNFRKQPNLEEVAEKIHISPFHFQRLFSEWAGTSPKKFLQYISLQYAKKLLHESRATLAETAYQTGLSGTSRLHDLFISIEGMTPAEYKNGGKNLVINYSFAESPFGMLIVASTAKGVCHLAFYENETDALSALTAQFPNAFFARRLDLMQQHALFIFQSDWSRLSQVKLHLKGTDFQLRVWEALLKIPMGNLFTYGQVAHRIDQPGASRAVGSAIGSNPVAFLIPCHRVIQSGGSIGGYKWGNVRKTAMIGWEAVKTNPS
jgi:AraC family transcriptional regulator of adaptative response/methylated-DNA-[protein]-cysteine methyltransferase